MDLRILSGGSKGNSIVIQCGEEHILVDAGIARTKIEKRLAEEGVQPDKVRAIYLTHEHGDHTKGVVIANKYYIPVYGSAGTLKTIRDRVEERLCNPIIPGRSIFPEYQVISFRTHHDAFDSYGYSFILPEKKISICLDTGRIDDDMLTAMQNSDIYIIEANHDPELVALSNYPDSVKARVLSDLGHLSNEQTAAALAQLITGRGEQIYLTHLSSANNMPALAAATVNAALRQRGYEAGKHYTIEVVSQ